METGGSMRDDSVVCSKWSLKMSAKFMEIESAAAFRFLNVMCDMRLWSKSVTGKLIIRLRRKFGL